MPLTITTQNNPLPASKIVSVADIRRLATDTGNPVPAGKIPTGITTSNLRTDLTGLSYDVQQSPTIRVRYKNGPVKLILSQQVYLCQDLSNVEREEWEKHEQLHVADNKAILAGIAANIRNDRTLKEILIDCQWIPLANGKINDLILGAMDAMWKSLTIAAVRRRDTAGEYARVEGNIKQRQGNLLAQGSTGPEVRRLQELLNVRLMPQPPLRIDGIFGPKTDRAVRDFQKVARLKVDGIVGPKTRDALKW